MNIAHYAIRCYESSARDGWWDKDVSREEQNMLMIGELCEAVTAYRHSRTPDVALFQSRLKELNDSINPNIILCDQNRIRNEHFMQQYNNYIKDTVADELADAAMVYLAALDHPTFLPEQDQESVIRATQKVYELKPHRNWGSHNFYENIYFIIHNIARSELVPAYNLTTPKLINELCLLHGYNLEWHIQQKLTYNTLRPKRKTW